MLENWLKTRGSYKITAARVRSFKGTNYLTIALESQIIPIDDIGETADVVHEDLGVVKKQLKVK